MIKEKARKKRFDDEKTLKQQLIGYSKTVFVSFFAALIFTILLSIHARSEMIKNIYANEAEKIRMEEAFAKQLVAQSDFTKDLQNKKYAMCMQVGQLYEAAQNYANAELAYKLAIEKAKTGVYTPYFKLAGVLIAQEKYQEAEDIINSLTDTKNITLIKSKTRAYLTMGDKYYSTGKFLSAAKSYEMANYYYNRFKKQDKVVAESINERIVNAYIQTADVMVKNGYNSDGVRFLKKAEKRAPKNYLIKYKLGIIYSDLDPVKAVQYFVPLLNKMPQDIDYEVYTAALMKASNILDLENKPTQAKQYRYKIRSIDIFIKQNVIYRNDVEIIPEDIKIRKPFFKYIIDSKFVIKNTSGEDIRQLYADFVLRNGKKEVTSYTTKCVDKLKPLTSDGGVTEPINIKFNKNIFTKRELKKYFIDIYVYKDKKYKTLAATIKLPE